MRDLIRHLVDDALGSGDRTSAEPNTIPTATLAADAIRLAAMATSLHFDVASHAPAVPDDSSVREATR